ncbi:MAG TPA: HD domain-containing protein [Candidatus Marinimicrobia bacterium]|nr:HD domain-containing protein [Candidatus Neomarinimicrobiota bacterium]
MKPITQISSFKEGASIQGFYLCVEKHLRHTRAGDLYLDLILRDNSGTVPAKIWDKVDEFNEKFSAGNPVAIKGNIESFKDRLQLVIKKINIASVKNYGRYGFDPSLIVPTSPYNPNKMWKRVVQIIGKMKNPFLKKVVSNIFREHKDKLLIHPASVMMHHNYRSGFLEHILSMAKIAEKLTPLYKLDQDLVMAGVLLHDIGKLTEISSSLEAEYTDEGNFIGHIVIGRDMVREASAKIKGFPKILQQQLEHIILSHQGKFERQSPKQPSFEEALLVHFIDNLDAKMNLMKLALEEDQQDGKWTDRKNIFRTALYKGIDESK